MRRAHPVAELHTPLSSSNPAADGRAASLVAPGSDGADGAGVVVGTGSDEPVSLAAVLFDMDGTVLDSEKIWKIALDELAASLGGVLSAPARAEMVGSNLARSIRILHEDLGVAVDDEVSARRLLERTQELFATRLEYKPGARELLDAVHRAGIPMALVTSTHRILTDVALNWIGHDYFAASVCGDEVSPPKPDAAPYARAAQLLAVPATHCVAVEDSPIGIAAAEAAGCAVLAVPSEVPIDLAPTRTVRSTLVGLEVDDLRQILRTRPHAAAQLHPGGS